jgi:hypothetical protein
MYIRKNKRLSKGKIYVNYHLVESVSTERGPRQKTICSLGDLKPKPRKEWLKLARKMVEALSEEPDANTAQLRWASRPRKPKEH